MNFDLGSNSNKMIFLVAAGIALLLALNVYQKQVGKNVAIVLSVVVIVVVGFFGYRLLNEEDVEVESNELNNLLNNVNNGNVNAHVNNGNAVQLNNVPELEEEVSEDILEGFQGENNEEENNVANNASNNASNNAANNNVNANVNANANANSNNVANNNTLNSQNLLPEGDTLFSNVNPSNNGGVINASLLNAGHHIGVNTQGCSLRNANRGLRSEPPNPQTQVSPWLQTTICPDLYRKPLE
tara:strand:- start:97 stop:822 length:726 start_codon:yes stop_codon:yes gene_type:complete